MAAEYLFVRMLDSNHATHSADAQADATVVLSIVVEMSMRGAFFKTYGTCILASRAYSMWPVQGQQRTNDGQFSNFIFVGLCTKRCSLQTNALFVLYNIDLQPGTARLQQPCTGRWHARRNVGHQATRGGAFDATCAAPEKTCYQHWQSGEPAQQLAQ